MLPNVRERLLHDPENHELSVGCLRFNSRIDTTPDREAEIGELLRDVIDGRRQAEVVEDGSPNAANQPPRLRNAPRRYPTASSSSAHGV